MKENVIIGKLIPAGTGMKSYRNTYLDTDKVLDVPVEDNITFEDILEMKEVIEEEPVDVTEEFADMVEE